MVPNERHLLPEGVMATHQTLESDAFPVEEPLPGKLLLKKVASRDLKYCREAGDLGTLLMASEKREKPEERGGHVWLVQVTL